MVKLSVCRCNWFMFFFGSCVLLFVNVVIYFVCWMFWVFVVLFICCERLWCYERIVFVFYCF